MAIPIRNVSIAISPNQQKMPCQQNVAKCMEQNDSSIESHRNTRKISSSQLNIRHNAGVADGGVVDGLYQQEVQAAGTVHCG